MPREKLPTQAECMKLLREHGMPDNMIDHTRMVTKVAMHIGRKLKEKGVRIDLDLLNRAALLHDIAKFETLHINKPVHHTVGEKIIKKEGYPKVARVVRNHALDMVLIKNALKTWEDKVLNYADTRVIHNKIVSVDKRIAYLKERYGHLSKEVVPRINKIEPLLKELEKEILSKAGVDVSFKELKKRGQKRSRRRKKK